MARRAVFSVSEGSAVQAAWCMHQGAARVSWQPAGTVFPNSRIPTALGVEPVFACDRQRGRAGRSAGMIGSGDKIPTYHDACMHSGIGCQPLPWHVVN